MAGPLAGRWAVVTGASRGIGAATAQRLAAEGAAVIRVARSLAPLEEPRRIDLPCDLTDDDARERTLDRILEAGTPALLVNNAGAFALGPFETEGLATLDLMYRANLRAPFAVAQRLLPRMREAGGGRHVLVGSIADHRAFAGNAAYAASKFGARGLHEVLREEYRGSPVRCSLVSPGPTDTAVWDPYDPDGRPDLPPRRAMLTPDDVAEAICWIATRPPHVDVDWLRIGPG